MASPVRAELSETFADPFINCAILEPISDDEAIAQAADPYVIERRGDAYRCQQDWSAAIASYNRGYALAGAGDAATGFK